ncbi:4947_t:CDS:2, partial [Racocetra fulgida]
MGKHKYTRRNLKRYYNNYRPNNESTKRTAEDDGPSKKQKLVNSEDPATTAVAYAGSVCKAENEAQNALNESHVELSEHEACSPTDT